MTCDGKVMVMDQHEFELYVEEGMQSETWGNGVAYWWLALWNATEWENRRHAMSLEELLERTK